MLIFLDSHVSKCSPDSIVTPSAYLLFYRRRSDAPLGPSSLQDLVNRPANADSDDDSNEDSSDQHSGNGRQLGSSAYRKGYSGLPSASDDQGADHHLGAAGSASIDRSILSDNPPEYHEDEGLGGMEEDNSYGGVSLNHEPTWGFPADGPSGHISDASDAAVDGDEDEDAAPRGYNPSYRPYSAFQADPFESSGHPSSPAEEMDDVPELAHQSQNAEYEAIETIETDEPPVQEIHLEDSEESHLKSD